MVLTEICDCILPSPGVAVVSCFALLNGLRVALEVGLEWSGVVCVDGYEILSLVVYGN